MCIPRGARPLHTPLNSIRYPCDIGRGVSGQEIALGGPRPTLCVSPVYPAITAVFGRASGLLYRSPTVTVRAEGMSGLDLCPEQRLSTTSANNSLQQCSPWHPCAFLRLPSRFTRFARLRLDKRRTHLQSGANQGRKVCVPVFISLIGLQPCNPTPLRG